MSGIVNECDHGGCRMSEGVPSAISSIGAAVEGELVSGKMGRGDDGQGGEKSLARVRQKGRGLRSDSEPVRLSPK